MADDSFTGLYVSTVSINGRVIASERTVDLSSRYAGLATAEAIIDAYHASTGLWCTLPEALAAAHSVPDGAPIAMAVDNVGVAWRPLDAARWEARASALHRVLR